MQICIGKNLNGPELGLGVTHSRLFLRDTPLRFRWKHINGIRLHIRAKVYFIELWSVSFPGRGFIYNMYKRRTHGRRSAR